jgi:hypothetical protein
LPISGLNTHLFTRVSLLSPSTFSASLLAKTILPISSVALWHLAVSWCLFFQHDLTFLTWHLV